MTNKKDILFSKIMELVKEYLDECEDVKYDMWYQFACCVRNNISQEGFDIVAVTLIPMKYF